MDTLNQRLRWASALILAAVLLVASGGSASAAVPTTTRVSVGTGGSEASLGGSILDISGDGRFVVFSSKSDDLVGGDTNGVTDVFVHDLVSDTTRRVDISTSGVQANAGGDEAVISANGRYVAFNSAASNLRNAKRDTNNATDVYLRDTVRGVTILVSRKRNGDMFPRGATVRAITSDGRFIGFAANRPRRPEAPCVYLRDRGSHTTSRVGCVDISAGVTGAFVSDDGRYVSWSDENSHAFFRDRVLGKTRRFPIGGKFGYPQLSDMTPDAHYLVFSSEMSGGDERVLVWNRLTGDVTDASVRLGGLPGRSSIEAGISSDGRYVLFWSTSSKLVVGDTNGRGDDFVRDLQAGTTVRISVAADGSQSPSGALLGPLGYDLPLAFSADGRFAGFDGGKGLVAGDTNRTRDAFLRGPLR